MKKEDMIIYFMIILSNLYMYFHVFYEILNRKISFFDIRGDIGEVSLAYVCIYVPFMYDASTTRRRASSYV